MILDYISDKQNIKSSDLLGILDVKKERIKKLLQQLIAEGLIVCKGGNRNRTYNLPE